MFWLEALLGFGVRAEGPFHVTCIPSVLQLVSRNELEQCWSIRAIQDPVTVWGTRVVRS